MIKCQHCHAETSNGLALCDLCQRLATDCLTFLPTYIRNLARWRPGRAGSRPVPGSRVLYIGPVDQERTGDRISDRLDEAMNMLTTWARVLTGARPGFPRPLTAEDAALCGEQVAEVVEDQAAFSALLCTGLEQHLTSIATTDWCGELVRDIARREATLRGLTESAIPGWYAGACRKCEAPTHVVPGLTWVTCGGCGSTTYARDHLEIILAEAEWWIAPPKRIAEALVALLDTEMSVPRLHKRISKWGERGRIEAHRRLDADGDEVGPKRYRLGRVMEVLAQEGATRATREAAIA